MYYLTTLKAIQPNSPRGALACLVKTHADVVDLQASEREIALADLFVGFQAGDGVAIDDLAFVDD